ncbi:MAG: hypothetical protein A2503_05980 [Burkholderiales bacterium RIFOXYD12_FULL_59_19]|nr:MAG: hypothetical protein A2503_05980 [Burkholderiales bacterium RIFOXYD12_FULL_59_19]
MKAVTDAMTGLAAAVLAVSGRSATGAAVITPLAGSIAVLVEVSSLAGTCKALVIAFCPLDCGAWAVWLWVLLTMAASGRGWAIDGAAGV